MSIDSHISKRKISELVAALPEIYQPIFGHENEFQDAQRTCRERLEQVVTLYSVLSNQLGRALNVLDLGCAQGYFSLSLAALGANVVGVDYLQENIDVCQALAESTGLSNVRFETQEVSDLISKIQKDQYDLVLGLSVFHHIADRSGHDSVVLLFSKLAECSAVAVVELALAEEPLPWAKSLPKDPHATLEPFSFIRRLRETKTHLSDIERPLFVCSNRMVILRDRVFTFERYTKSPHPLAKDGPMGTRRYFFGNGILIKQFRIDGQLAQHNIEEITSEFDYLSRYSDLLEDTPLPLHFEKDHYHCVLARELVEGELLIERLLSGAPVSPIELISQILDQLCALEHNGLYHTDLRTWNVIVTASGRYSLIDFGAIRTTPRDSAWPSDIFVSFFCFLGEVALKSTASPTPLRTPRIHYAGLPDPFASAIRRMWSSPRSEWSFSSFRDIWLSLLPCLDSTDQLSLTPCEHNGNAIWALEIELFLSHLLTLVRDHNEILAEQQTHLSSLEKTAHRETEAIARSVETFSTHFTESIKDQDLRIRADVHSSIAAVSDSMNLKFSKEMSEIDLAIEKVREENQFSRQQLLERLSEADGSFSARLDQISADTTAMLQREITILNDMIGSVRQSVDVSESRFRGELTKVLGAYAELEAKLINHQKLLSNELSSMRIVALTSARKLQALQLSSSRLRQLIRECEHKQSALAVRLSEMKQELSAELNEAVEEVRDSVSALEDRISQLALPWWKRWRRLK
jgi:O-antigen chain-terminating methyltransferase